MKTDYKVIAGVGRGRGAAQGGVRSRLYEGPDHLLVVHSSGYTEEYKRVFYRDVRYVVARKSIDQMVLGGFCVLGILISLIFFFSKLWGVGIVVAFPFAIGLAVNLLRGPTCRTFVNTDVQTLELPVPRRMKKVPSLVAFLNGKVASGQPQVGQQVT